MSKVLKNALVLKNDFSFEKRTLYIENDRISEFAMGEVEDLDGMLIMPGLVNTHTHAAMTMFRGIAEDVDLKEWLFKYIFPRENKLTEKDVYIGSLVGFMEMVKNGITTFVDMYFYEDAIYQAAKDIGIRGIVARGLADTDGKGEKKLHLAEEFIKKHLDDDLVKGGFGPHALYTCSMDYFKEIIDVSKKYDLPVTFHLLEAPNERMDFKKATGIESVEFLDSIGAFEKHTIIAHGTDLNEDELRLISKRGSTLSYNPTSNAKLGNGIAPIKAAIEMGINVTLGTDSAASNNSLNIFSEMKFGALLQRAKFHDPKILKLEEIIKMATSNARKSLPFDVGTLESGMLADLVVIDLNDFSMVPTENMLANIVYSFDTASIKRVMIGGKWIYDGEFLTVDGKKVIEDFEKAYSEVNSRL
jgi:5-methylthioadenosine/S-adenosylhomocysteine deaminase